jgi:hypothetical protein
MKKAKPSKAAAKKQSGNSTPIFWLEIQNSKGWTVDRLEITRDGNDQLWLHDEPMTLGEVRHLWSMIHYAMDDEGFKGEVWKELTDTGTMQACRAGRE